MQADVRAFLAGRAPQADAERRYIDLVSEVGELGKELLKATDYGAQPFARTQNTAMEIGDCLFSLLALCEALDVDAQDALSQALAKYESRLKTSGGMGSDQTE